MFTKNQDPVCGFDKKSCLREQCQFWVHLLGKDPQTGVAIDKYDCSFRFLPVLLIEGAQQTRQAGAAIESFRNEMVRANEAASALNEVKIGRLR